MYFIFIFTVDVSDGSWYVTKKATFNTEGVEQNSRWLFRSSCTKTSGTGPCDDGEFSLLLSLSPCLFACLFVCFLLVISKRLFAHSSPVSIAPISLMD